MYSGLLPSAENSRNQPLLAHLNSYIHNPSAAAPRVTDRISHLTLFPPTVAILKIILYLLLYLMLIIELVSLNKD